MTRPPKWDDWLPEVERLPDEAWEAVPDEDWTTDLSITAATQCRRMTAGERCTNPGVAIIRRGYRPYLYCADHLYNRWIEDGVVLIWRVREEYR